VSKVVTDLGAAGLTLTLALVCAGALALRRRWPEAVALAAGMGLTFLGVHELKDAIDRPRPSGALVEVEGSSFPSGHAAYSTVFVFLAIMVVVRLRTGLRRGSVLLIGALAISAVVGLSRVYLEVHYLSDVSAGWALGAAAFALCAAATLLVSALRHNQRR
jgi:undecaprenyl-diphosphatase